MTAKVIERNSTAIRTGIAVAPVTDWRYYDTIYTERYMGTLEENKAGYDEAAITDMDGFRDSNFLFIHGSGDDNGESELVLTHSPVVLTDFRAVAQSTTSIRPICSTG